MSDTAGDDERDEAWVTIETPFGNSELLSFLDDVERLYRINPMLVFERWEQTGGCAFRLAAKNLSNGKRLDTGLEAEFTNDGVIVRYDSGIRSSTSFRVEGSNTGDARLIVTDDYSGTPRAERDARVDEVDRSLVQWGNALYRYLRQRKRWSWVPGWRFYMRRVWQPMRPMARRITFILLVLTLAEIVLFGVVFTVFRLELDKYIG